MRLFLGVFPPGPVVSVLEGMQRQLAVLAGKGALRLVRPEQIHLTLRFLGEVEESGIEALAADLGEALKGASGMRLSLGGIGAFPERGRPRVIWVGLGGDVGALGLLQGRVEAAVAGHGVKPADQVFHPHLTVARVREDPRGGMNREAVLGGVRVPRVDPWTVDRVRLMGSELRPEGPVYSVVREWPLGLAG